MKTSILAAALMAAACGSSTDSLGTGGTGSCTATLSGAVTGSDVQCIAVAGLDSNGDGNGAVAFTFTAPAGYQVAAGVQTIGTPTTRTYANTDSGAKGACEVTSTTGSAATWAATAGSSADQGTYSMTVSSLGNGISNPDGGGEVFLSMHGSLNCTMPAFPGSGSSGTVTLTATF